MREERLAFSLELLMGARADDRPLTVCDLGHLRVRERTCWAPEAFSRDMRAVLCRWVQHPDH